MKILIHACPKRMWYVEDFLVPQLLNQGADSVAIWNDDAGLGNLQACMKSFSARRGYGGTWHIQDDVLPCRDFVKRCAEYESDGVVYGFCCRQFQDDPRQPGRVHVPDAWRGFQCVRIPDETARACADWFFSGRWEASPNPELPVLAKMGRGDDSFFREFMMTDHGGDRVTNAAPNLVEHVDWILGGSVLSPWRDHLARSALWTDKGLVEELKTAVRGKVQY